MARWDGGECPSCYLHTAKLPGRLNNSKGFVNCWFILSSHRDCSCLGGLEVWEWIRALKLQQSVGWFTMEHNVQMGERMGHKGMHVFCSLVNEGRNTPNRTCNHEGVHRDVWRQHGQPPLAAIERWHRRQPLRVPKWWFQVIPKLYFPLKYLHSQVRVILGPDCCSESFMHAHSLKHLPVSFQLSKNYSEMILFWFQGCRVIARGPSWHRKLEVTTVWGISSLFPRSRVQKRRSYV